MHFAGIHAETDDPEELQMARYAKAEKEWESFAIWLFSCNGNQIFQSFWHNTSVNHYFLVQLIHDMPRVWSLVAKIGNSVIQHNGKTTENITLCISAALLAHENNYWSFDLTNIKLWAGGNIQLWSTGGSFWCESATQFTWWMS